MKTMSRTLVGISSLAAVGLLMSLVGQAQAQFSETEFRAGDGTAYQLLRAVPPLGIGAEKTIVTTVSGSSTGVGGCNLSQSMAGGIAAAIAGVLPPGQTLHPFNQISRTGILTPDDIDIDHFFSSFGGRVQLGTSNADCTGAGAPNACCTGVGTGTCSPLNVCHTAFDCMGQPNVQTLVPLSSATGGIPAACIANGVSAGTQCDGTNVRNVFAFGLPATGNVCDNPLNVTADTTICAPAPTDGFTLIPGQGVVFVYDGNLLGLGFSIGAAGFGVDTDTINSPGCMANQVVGADTRLDSNPGLGTPSPTPTETPTNTPSQTPTETPTRTFTATSTATFTSTFTLTPTATVTPSLTATPTFTFTQTATQTNTPTQTPTRPPIPVVPSPTSPAGLALIAGLGVGLLWALRRLAGAGK